MGLSFPAKDPRVRRYGFHDPGVAADDRARADYGISAEYFRARVNRDVVADGRVPLVATRALGCALALDAQGAERYSLVDLHVVADLRGLADHDAGAMVDEEPGANARSGVDVDTGLAVSVLRDDAR